MDVSMRQKQNTDAAHSVFGQVERMQSMLKDLKDQYHNDLTLADALNGSQDLDVTLNEVSLSYSQPLFFFFLSFSFFLSLFLSLKHKTRPLTPMYIIYLYLYIIEG